MDDDDLYESFVEEAREHLDRLDGTKVPEFVQVLDGWYSERLVVDEIHDCIEVTSYSSVFPVAMLCHTEPCHIPRYRPAVRWVLADV